MLLMLVLTRVLDESLRKIGHIGWVGREMDWLLLLSHWVVEFSLWHQLMRASEVAFMPTRGSHLSVTSLNLGLWHSVFATLGLMNYPWVLKSISRENLLLERVLVIDLLKHRSDVLNVGSADRTDSRKEILRIFLIFLEQTFISVRRLVSSIRGQVRISWSHLRLLFVHGSLHLWLRVLLKRRMIVWNIGHSYVGLAVFLVHNWLIFEFCCFNRARVYLYFS